MVDPYALFTKSAFNPGSGVRPDLDPSLKNRFVSMVPLLDGNSEIGAQLI